MNIGITNHRTRNHHITNHPRFLPLWFLVLGAAPLAVALLAQYGFQLHPCHFCLLERYPYGLVLAMGIAAFFTHPHSLARQLTLAFALCGLIATGILSLLHTGIEQGWLSYSGGCIAQALAPQTSLNDLRAQILAAPQVACNEVTASLLGLSMAGWNAVFSLTMAALSVLLFRPRKKM